MPTPLHRTNARAAASAPGPASVIRPCLFLAGKSVRPTRLSASTGVSSRVNRLFTNDTEGVCNNCQAGSHRCSKGHRVGARYVNPRPAYLRRIGKTVMWVRFSWSLSCDGDRRARTVIDGVQRGHPAASLERVNPLRPRPHINASTRTNGFLITTPALISHRCLSAVPPPPGRRLQLSLLQPDVATDRHRPATSEGSAMDTSAW